MVLLFGIIGSYKNSDVQESNTQLVDLLTDVSFST